MAQLLRSSSAPLKWMGTMQQQGQCSRLLAVALPVPPVPPILVLPVLTVQGTDMSKQALWWTLDQCPTLDPATENNSQINGTCTGQFSRKPYPTVSFYKTTFFYSFLPFDKLASLTCQHSASFVLQNKWVCYNHINVIITHFICILYPHQYPS